MRLLLFSLIVFTSFSYLFGQDTNKVVTDEESGKPMLVGPCTREAFSDTSFSWWFDSGYKMYEPDSLTVDSIKQDLDGVNVTLVMGTWCSDSRNEVPPFFKIMDQANYPSDKIKIICVDRDKKGTSGEADSLNIELVPTFIFYRDNKEIGRIEESPEQTLEEDIYAILKRTE
jgi:hypothetical protein